MGYNVNNSFYEKLDAIHKDKFNFTKHENYKLLDVVIKLIRTYNH